MCVCACVHPFGCKCECVCVCVRVHTPVHNNDTVHLGMDKQLHALSNSLVV